MILRIRYAWLAGMHVYCLCVYFSIPTLSVAIEPLRPEQVRAAMLHERGKLVNGSFSAFGEFYNSDPRSPREALDGSFEWKMRFDLTAENFEFDRVEPKRGVAGGVVRTFYSAFGDSSYYFTDYLASAAWLRIRKRTASPVEPGDFQFFDVRGLGTACSPMDICVHSRKGMDSFFDHYDVKQGSKIEVKQESENILRLSFTALEGQLATTLWIDTAQGYTPVREVHTQSGKVLDETKTDWEKLNEVWVPVSFTSTCKTPHFKPNTPMKIENIVWQESRVRQSLSWQHVNASAKSAIQFDYKSLELPEFTQVFDERGSVPKLIHVYGRELPRGDKNIPTRSGRFVYGVLAFVGVCILILFVFTTKRARRR